MAVAKASDDLGSCGIHRAGVSIGMCDALGCGNGARTQGGFVECQYAVICKHHLPRDHDLPHRRTGFSEYDLIQRRALRCIVAIVSIKEY